MIVAAKPSSQRTPPRGGLCAAAVGTRGNDGGGLR
jgi:hypothetical protein